MSDKRLYISDLPKEKLRLLFSDVLREFCIIIYKGREVKAKHFTHFDIADFDIKYNEYYEEAIRNGAPTIEEREKILIEEGSWTLDRDKQIKDNCLFVSNMKETKAKLFRQAEIEQINNTIRETEKKIRLLEEEKGQLLQYTAESYASKRITEYQIFQSLFIGDIPLFNNEERDLLSDQEVITIISSYNERFAIFNECNFKRIALSNFFLNSFYLCKDNPFTFYGKPIIKLTLFQVEIFGHAVYFKNILTHAPNKPPTHILEDPDKLIDWYNATQSIKREIDKGKKSEDIIGLSRQDKELLGIQTQYDPHKKLIELAKKKGSALDSNDILRLQGLI